MVLNHFMVTEFTIGPDYLEVVSFIGAAAVTHGAITIKNAGNKYLDMIRLVFGRLGVTWQERWRRYICTS